MTTFTFSGARVDYDGDTTTNASSIEAAVTVTSASSTFTYTFTGEEDDGVFFIDMNDDVAQAILGGVNLDNPDFDVLSEEALITQANWKSGGSSVILIISLETGANTDTEFYFVLDGKALPDIDTLGWSAVENDIASLTKPTGAYGANSPIAWSSIDGATSTEDDEFYGTPGRDTFYGGAGDDYFVSSNGRDTYNGGSGTFDQVAFTNDPNGVIAHLGKGTATDGWGKTDTLKSIEALRGSAHDDKLIGNGKANYFRGIEGNDTINGGKGKDEVRYDRDARYGGEDGVTVDLAKGFAIDGFGDRDTLKSIERARGSESADKLLGNGGGNRLMGLGGNDTLSGKGGDDLIMGGAGRDKILGDGGNDDLFGDGGADRFIFRGAFGDDTVSDFETAGRKEKIDLSDVTPIKSFRDLKNNHLSENGDGDAVISDNNGNTITLDGIGIADLSGNDFIF
ncbi:calcium-binding protein [Leisingera aquaemixtae]|uniref:Cyclolysin n=1 Tax=Leisingera aquaemixtae TaxID=1396826 RepID=A0A0N7M5B7_9RHOB|nr:calcium-binding protein [Leisingera aquaemixtae]CUI01986.1 Cyclolysin [Leisingera aquaemixtae]